MPRRKSRRKSKKRSKSPGTKKGQVRKTARRAYKKKRSKSRKSKSPKRKSKSPKRKSKSPKRRSRKRRSRKKSKKRSKSKSSRSLKQLKTRAKRGKKKGDQERCEYGRAVNDRCLENRGKLSQGMATKYRYNKAPLQGKLLRVQQSDAGPVVYTNLNSKESIVIPMNPEELEKYFGSSEEMKKMRNALVSQKRNLRIKYNELDKVHKKLENINKQKVQKKEPVHPNCEMVMAMISSNLKLAGEKLAELDSQCKALEKSHGDLKAKEDSNKKAAQELRTKIRALTSARKSVSDSLSSARRKKLGVQKLLESIMKMEIKVSHMCKSPAPVAAPAGDLKDVAAAGADSDVRDAAKDKAIKSAKLPPALPAPPSSLPPNMGFAMDDEELSEDDLEFYY